MAVSDTIKLAVKSVTSSMKRDTYSGDSFDVAVIDRDGFRELTAEEKASVLRSLQAN